MKKDRILAAIIAGLILTNLAACGKYEPAATADTGITAPTDSTAADVPSATNPSDDIPAGTAPPATDGMETVESAQPETTAEKEEITSPPQSAATAPTEPAEPQPTKPAEQKPPEDTKPTETTQAPATEPPATQPPTTQPPVTEPPATEPPVTQPPVTEPPATEPPPTIQPPVTEPPATEPPTGPEPPVTEPVPTQPPATESEFDVGYWVSFAKSYAQSIGLELDSEAVYCWDNPTIASANSKYLERDLTGLLNKYSRDEDITAVWVWASQRTESSWDIYIGYA